MNPVFRFQGGDVCRMRVGLIAEPLFLLTYSYAGGAIRPNPYYNFIELIIIFLMARGRSRSDQEKIVRELSWLHRPNEPNRCSFRPMKCFERRLPEFSCI